MPSRTTIPKGAPCWVDLMTSDPDRSRSFYGELLGWEAETPAEELGGYVNFTSNGVRVAGCMAKQAGETEPDAWSVYLATDDARRAAGTAASRGGHVVVEPDDVGDLGTMAVVTDPGGAWVGLWQPGLHRGFGVLGEPGAPSWFELRTRDYQRTLAFYREVFGWDTHTVSEEPRYTTMKDGDDWLAGVFEDPNLPDGAAAHWVVYFGVADAGAAAAKVIELGGSVLEPPEDTPYGRIVTVADPMGATFLVVAGNDPMPARDA